MREGIRVEGKDKTMNKKTQQEKIIEKLKEQEQHEEIKDYLSVDYYDIAERHLEQTEQNLEDWEIRQNSLISIIFSALTLEAAINDIGIEYLKETFDNIEKLNFPNKWREIIKLLLKKNKEERELKRFNILYGDLKKLQKLRNDLVHYKIKFESRIKDKNSKKLSMIDKRVNKDEARKYFELIEDTLKVFYKLTNVAKNDIPVLLKIEEKEKGKIIHQFGRGKSSLPLRAYIKRREEQ